MNKNSIKAIFISGIGALINYAISFLLTPYITNNVGIDAYGFVSIAKTFVSYASIITLALTVFIVRYITIHYHKKEFVEAASYYSSSLNACVKLSLIILLTSSIMIFNLDRMINIPNELIVSVKLLFLLVFVNFAITTISTPLTASVYIKNRIDVIGIIKIIGYSIEAIAMIMLFTIFKPSVWFVGAGALISSIISIVLYWKFTANNTPELKYDNSLVSNEKTKDLLNNGIWSSINQLGNTLNSGLDLLISNLMLSGIETGQIAVAKTIGGMASAFEEMIFQVTQPDLLKSYSAGDVNNFISVLKEKMKICGFFGATIFAGFFALGILYYKLWLPGQDFQALYILTVITLMNHVTDSLMRPVYYVSTLTVRNKIPCWITIGGGILNIAGMFILLKHTNLGVYSVVITTAVIMISINMIFNPLYAMWCLNYSKKALYPTIIKHLCATALMCAIFILMTRMINPNSWIGLILSAGCMFVVGMLVYSIIQFGFKKARVYFRNCISVILHN